jgi:hypothetical protein
MRPRRSLALPCCIFPAIACGTLPAHTQKAGTKVTTVTLIFDQLVLFSMPADFVTVHEQSNAKGYIREAVPQGESVEDWTQMITVQGFKGLATRPDLTPESFAAQIAERFQQACPQTFTSNSIGALTFAGHPAFAGVARCGRVGKSAIGQGETTMLIFIKGATDYYGLQWAERSMAIDKQMDIDLGPWRERLEKLQPIKLCRRVPGEPAPYPSCQRD